MNPVIQFQNANFVTPPRGLWKLLAGLAAVICAPAPAVATLAPTITPPGTTTPLARIVRFTGTPTTIVRGESAKLSYKLENAERASINPSVGEIDLVEGNLSVSPAKSTTYTLTVFGRDGVAKRQRITINVRPRERKGPTRETPKKRDKSSPAPGPRARDSSAGTPPAMPTPDRGSPQIGIGAGIRIPIGRGTRARTPMPAFPWPPPAASAETVIPNSWLATRGEADLADVAVRLESALHSAKYPKWSYSSAPNGFALVSQIEQIKADGTPSSEPARWSTDLPWVTNMTLLEFVRALVNAQPGYYRVIVFIVTNQPWSRTGVRPTGAEASEWLPKGFTWLPDSIGKLPYGPDYRTTALVYEFRKVSKHANATLLEPSPTSADGHLKKAGISDWLSQR